MALTRSKLNKKRKKKADRRAELRRRKKYLFRRYGEIVGAKVYEHERTNVIRKGTTDGKRTRTVVVKRPQELLDLMKQADTFGRVNYRTLPSTQTTGDVHRARRKARKQT
jgi:hypothetical protein